MQHLGAGDPGVAGAVSARRVVDPDRQRAGHLAASSGHPPQDELQRGDSAGPRHAGGGADDAVERSRGKGRNPQAGSALSRQSGGESLLCPVFGFHGRAGSVRAGRCRSAQDCARWYRRPEHPLSGRPVPAVPPAACVVRKRAALDRPGAKARQDRRSQRFLAGRQARNPADRAPSRADPLRNHPGRRYATAARNRAAHGRDHRASAECGELDPETRVRRTDIPSSSRASASRCRAPRPRDSRVMSDAAGTDPYCQAVSDAQQDLFGEAIFHGKAIYDVQAFRTVFAIVSRRKRCSVTT